MERVVFYMRKSTEIQPWDNQKDVLDKYVADHADMQVVGEYCDVGSGSKVLPNIEKLLEDAEKGMFDTVLVSATNRLGRDLHLLTEVFRLFKKYGVSFVDISNPFLETKTVVGKETVAYQLRKARRRNGSRGFFEPDWLGLFEE